jgi:hypothetical protein
MRQRFIAALKAASDLINAKEPVASTEWVDCKPRARRGVECVTDKV